MQTPLKTKCLRWRVLPIKIINELRNTIAVRVISGPTNNCLGDIPNSRQRRGLSALALVLMQASCGGDHLPALSGTLRHRSPQSPGEMGQLIQVSDQQMQTLLGRDPQISYRILSASQGIYEIYTKKSVAPQTFMNQWLPAVAPQKLTPASCPPNLQLQIVSHDGRTPLLGDTIEIAIKDHETSPRSPESRTYEVIVTPPPGAAVDWLQRSPSHLTLRPNSVGNYWLSLVSSPDEAPLNTKSKTEPALNSSLFIDPGCTLGTLQFIVTANPPLDFSAGATNPAEALLNFWHLGELQWESSHHEPPNSPLLAIIDTGLHYNHPWIRPSVHVFNGEVPGNGLDEDGNGREDDYFGYDFVNDDPYPFDDEGHGSHVGALAASPTMGVYRHAQLLGIKALSAAFGGDIGTVIAAIHYAIDSRARVINLSFGIPGPAHPLLLRALQRAAENRVIVVAAAGNGHNSIGIGLDLDSEEIFPASTRQENVIAVGASLQGLALAPYSNYGKKTVELAAPGGLEPGDLILSATSENAESVLYSGRVGTSMAAPQVSGAVTLLVDQFPNYSISQLRHLLKQGTLQTNELKDYLEFGGVLNWPLLIKAIDKEVN